LKKLHLCRRKLAKVRRARRRKLSRKHNFLLRTNLKVD
jgi:hypothetical protein